MSAIEPPQAHLKQIVAPHLDAAYNLARWLAGNDIDAENIALQACLRALRLPGGFRGTNGRSWLLAIVRNTAYPWLKLHRPKAVVSIGDEEPSELENPTALSNHLSTLHDVNRSALQAALELLSVEFRETLVLRELEGCAYKEIADITEVPIGTVMSRLAQVRRQLLDTLVGKEINKMNCQEINPLLHAYVDGELDLMRSLDVERHLENCSACAGVKRLLQSLHSTLRQNNLSYPAPASIWRVF